MLETGLQRTRVSRSSVGEPDPTGAAIRSASFCFPVEDDFASSLFPTAASFQVSSCSLFF